MRRLTFKTDSISDKRGRSMCYGDKKQYVEFERAYPEAGSRCPVAWFLNRSHDGEGISSYAGFVVFCGPGHRMAKRVETEKNAACVVAPKTHRLYKAFRAVLDGLPPEPFLDMLVEDFPQFEAVVSRFLETEEKVDDDRATT